MISNHSESNSSAQSCLEIYFELVCISSTNMMNLGKILNSENQPNSM